MDDAAHLAAVLGADGDDIAPVAQGNHRILQEFVGGGVLDDVVQFDTDGIFRLPDLAT